jgi:hypothetical protein
MDFVEFFDLVRQHKEVGGEEARLDKLEGLEWDRVPTRWIVMALEKFAVVLFLWNREHPEAKNERVIALRSRVYGELMGRVVIKGEVTIEPDQDVRAA